MQVYPRIKRSLDICITLLALVLLSPVMVITGLIVFIGLGRPILFTQDRPGLHGKLFRIYKFRTLRNTTDAHGALLSDEERLSPLGHLLRTSSLDELPGLWNVLRGDMSLVGPRPLMAEYLPLYSPAQARRHDVRPGITGLAQVRGRNALAWQDRLSLDVWYVDHYSFWLDLKILFLTFVKVVRREGIAPSGKNFVEIFPGN